MKALMLAWHSAIRFAQLQGSLPGRVKPFDLIAFRDRHDPPALTYWEFNEKIGEACGCSPEQIYRMQEQVLRRQLEFLERIKRDLGLVRPGLGEQILNIIQHPIATPVPVQVQEPVSIPEEMPVYR